MYAVVLLAAVFVTGVGIAGVALSRVTLARTDTSTSASESEILAVAAVERAIAFLQATPTWRDDIVHKTRSSELPLGNGTISFELVEDLASDQDLKTNDGPVRIFGYGECNGTRRIHSVQISETFPFPSLGSAAHTDKKIVAASADIDADHLLSANGRISATLSTVRCNVESSTDITGSSYTGTTTPYVPVRAVPTASTVMSTWVAMASPIDLAQFPGVSGQPGFQQNVLGPGFNPFDVANLNPSGVYTVDCMGGDFVIRNSRILGTLVLQNVNAVTIEGDISWTPFVPNYPVLIVNGDIHLTYTSNSSLSELDEGVNFNPSGAPRAGKTDDNLNDNYDNTIDGLVYATGDVTFLSGRLDFNGCLIADGNLYFEAGSVTDFFYDPIYAMQPPPGFTAGTRPMQIIPGSWRWETE